MWTRALSVKLLWHDVCCEKRITDKRELNDDEDDDDDFDSALIQFFLLLLFLSSRSSPSLPVQMVECVMERRVNGLVGNAADVLSAVCHPSITPNERERWGFWVIELLTTLRAVSDKHTNQEWWGADTLQAFKDTHTHKHTRFLIV